MLSFKVIGKHVRAARLRLDLLQEEVAEKTTMSLAYYGKIERGEARPMLDKLVEIAVALQVPLESLLAGAVQQEYNTSNTADVRHDEFIQFFIDSSYHIDEKTKAALIVVCKEIITLHGGD